ncbi:MAG: hypothetical protein IM574_07965 [Cytophagales bacterium]|nr:hypothetical protein [Cytophagales bacterium]MCA6388069.1 hypothetical protein [Cytophagales bacterium]MCA6391798.1 hypothetical protein [Cytophagales bacterium]MCA6396028.1 hypothetical protein [Cytophagales bacterium]MCA6402629.1 hypothetical protein [Cytophagales bacterium]
MKRVERKVMMMAVMVLISFGGFAQKLDEARMERDIEVAENILSTLLKQQFDKRSFFPIEVRGNYRAGYGVTFTIPNLQTGVWMQGFDVPAMSWSNGEGSFSYSYSDGSEDGVTIIDRQPVEEHKEKIKQDLERAYKEKNRATSVAGSAPRAPKAPRAAGLKRTNSRLDRDSLREQSNKKVINAIKEFMADYSDLIGQLTPTERVVVTNRGENERFWFGQFDNQQGNTYLSVEANKSDLTQYKQNKMTRDQLMAKIKVVNSELDNELQPDLELLASIFNRLYRSDLSKTYFTQGNTYYERLKDFGVIYYMQVYSSNQQDDDFWAMPTISLNEIDQKTRDEKVKELYPLFAKSIKEDMLEYGRTLKSLKDDENLIFNIKLTRCVGCGIPSSLELTVKNSVLKDYSSGKLSKEAATQKITEKKGAEQ